MLFNKEREREREREGERERGREGERERGREGERERELLKHIIALSLSLSLSLSRMDPHLRVGRDSPGCEPFEFVRLQVDDS